MSCDLDDWAPLLGGGGLACMSSVVAVLGRWARTLWARGEVHVSGTSRPARLGASLASRAASDVGSRSVLHDAVAPVPCGTGGHACEARSRAPGLTWRHVPMRIIRARICDVLRSRERSSARATRDILLFLCENIRVVRASSVLTCFAPPHSRFSVVGGPDPAARRAARSRHNGATADTPALVRQRENTIQGSTQ